MKLSRIDNFNDFCFFKENRIKITDSKFKKLKDSIRTANHIICPIIAMPCANEHNLIDLDGNETVSSKHKYAVIDGQNRLLACREDDLQHIDVYFVNNTEANREDVVVANNTASPWGVEDYIGYYAKRGNGTYTRIGNLIKHYNGAFTLGTIIDTFWTSNGRSRKSIEKGIYSINEEFGKEVLQKCLSLKDVAEDEYRVAKFVRAIKSILINYKGLSIDKISDGIESGMEIEMSNDENVIKESILLIHDSQFPVLDGDDIPEDMRERVLYRDNYRCQEETGCDRTEGLHMHHVRPSSKGGKTSIENLKTLCSTHNIRRSNTHIDL